MADTDQIVLRKKMPKAADLKKESVINQAKRSGLAVETQQRYNGSSNKQHVNTLNTARLDQETEELKHKHVSLDVGKLVQQARQAKNLSQKDLATQINEKPQVIQEIEQGRAVRNDAILCKVEKALGMKLRGKDAGQPLRGPKKK